MIETVEGICPNCRHKVVIPKSVKQYQCVCDKFYNVIIVKKDDNTRIKEQNRTGERTEVPD